MKRTAMLMSVISASVWLGGCSKSDTTAQAPASTPVTAEARPDVKLVANDIGTLNNGAAALVPGPGSPGGAPTFGTQTGTGFSTGDAANSGGQGSGMMGFHGTGSMGTSHAISDEHPLPPPSPDAKDPVLPAQ